MSLLRDLQALNVIIILSQTWFVQSAKGSTRPGKNKDHWFILIKESTFSSSFLFLLFFLSFSPYLPSRTPSLSLPITPFTSLSPLFSHSLSLSLPMPLSFSLSLSLYMSGFFSLSLSLSVSLSLYLSSQLSHVIFLSFFILLSSTDLSTQCKAVTE